MHNSYFSSVHCSLRTNGYSHLLLNQKCDRASSSCCCCCRCYCCCSTCSLSTGVTPVNRAMLCGLRQSNLLQWSASRVVVLGVGDPVYCRVSSSGRDWGFGVGRGFNGRIGRGAVKFVVSEEGCGRFEFGGEARSIGGRFGRRVKGGDVKCVVDEDESDSSGFGSKERSFSGRVGRRIRGSRIKRMISEEESDEFGLGSVERLFNGRNERRVRGSSVKCMISEEESDDSGLGRMERRFNGRNRRRVRGSSVKCRMSEEESDGFGLGDVDEVINLLSEEVDDECFVNREGRGNVSRRVEMQKGGKSGSGGSFRRKSRIAGSDSVKNDAKSGFKVVKDEMREEESREEEKIRTNVLKDKNLRKESSSCSSYYSLPSTGDFDHEENYGRSLDESTEKQEVTDRARHEVSTSQIQEDKDISRKQLICEMEHHGQRSSIQQDISQSYYRDSSFRHGGPPQIRTNAESLNQEARYGTLGSSSSASQLYVDGNKFLLKEQYGTERSKAYGKPTSGSVCIDRATTQYVLKEGQYKEEGSSQYDFDSHSSSKNSLNEEMSGTASHKASVTRSGTGALISQSEGLTALHQDRYNREKKDETFREPSIHITDETAQGSAGHFEKSSVQFVGEFNEKEEQYRLKKPTQYDLDHTSNHGDSMQSELMSKSSMKEAPIGTSGSGSSVLHYRGGKKAFHQGLHIREERRDQSEYLGHLRQEDTLDSARNMECSSTQFVGEFMEKARNEILKSEVQKVKQNFNSELAYEREEVREVDGSQDDQHKEIYSKRTSEGSGTKGPSVEMWDVAEPLVQEASRKEQNAITTDNAVVRRSGKSFWSIVADVARLRWGSRAETPKSAGTSNGKSPSYDSASGKTWFTSHDHERSDEDTKGGRRSLPQATGSQLRQEEIISSTSGVTKARVEARYREVQGSTSSSPLETGSATKDASFMSPENNPDWDKNGKSSHTSLSGMDVMESPLPLLGESKVSPIVGERAETVRTQAPGICSMERTETNKSKASRSGSQIRETDTSGSSKSGSIEKIVTGRSEPAPTGLIKKVETGRSKPSRVGSMNIIETGRSEPSNTGLTQQLEQLGSTELIEASNSGERDKELKRRKLERNNQLLRDRFDEWEEACKLDIEQRKMDEMFMREALLEAQKAADSWEVPVGAVLVQHGKIIARGCNLVEELRDSTAHAEMICIREGSNVIRSWRLAETTLYVTLEPCPMCAGAILQARIDTVVWGAPNKLLGADGSWIRLFPDMEGGNGSEGTSKPAAPVHPFHPKITIRRGVLASECAEVMQQFFQLRRRKKEKKAEPPKEKKKAEPPKEKKGETSSPPRHLPVSHHPAKFLTKLHQIFHIFC